MDIVRPLEETQSGNTYIFSIQGIVIKYRVFIPLRETTRESILTNLLDHYIDGHKLLCSNSSEYEHA